MESHRTTRTPEAEPDSPGKGRSSRQDGWSPTRFEADDFEQTRLLNDPRDKLIGELLRELDLRDALGPTAVDRAGVRCHRPLRKQQHAQRKKRQAEASGAANGKHEPQFSRNRRCRTLRARASRHRSSIRRSRT